MNRPTQLTENKIEKNRDVSVLIHLVPQWERSEGKLAGEFPSNA